MSEQKRPYGPNAALNRSGLNEEDQALFDWSTDQIVNHNAKLFASLVQSVASLNPTFTYWRILRIVKHVMEIPGFQLKIEAAMQQAAVDLNKPTD